MPGICPKRSYLGLEADLALGDAVRAPRPSPEGWELLKEERLPPVAILRGAEMQVRGVCGARNGAKNQQNGKIANSGEPAALPGRVFEGFPPEKSPCCSLKHHIGEILGGVLELSMRKSDKFGYFITFSTPF